MVPANYAYSKHARALGASLTKDTCYDQSLKMSIYYLDISLIKY